MTPARRAVRESVPFSRARRWSAALLGALAFVLSPTPARGDGSSMADDSRTFEYTTPAKKYYFRAVLEELGLLSLGLAHYFANQEVNSVDWDLDYDWRSMRAKLVGDAYAFDTNRFDTNYVTHPAAGMLYYLAARGNRLSVLESIGFAFAASTIWEFAGEYRELVSVNDLVATPFSGVTLGESTTAIGAFFDRSCKGGTNSVLGSVFGWSKSLHDAIDDLEPARDEACDRFGLSTRGDHRFGLFAGNAAVTSGGSGTSGEVRLGALAEVVHLDGFGRPGNGWFSFSDGNVSSLSASVAVAAQRVSDLTVAARTVPFGLHYKNLADRPGFGVDGSELVLGFLIGSEYSQHRYDRPAGKVDRVFVLDLPAASMMFVVRRGARRIEASVDAGAALGAADAFALGAYRASGSSTTLSSVTEARGYSHGAGFAFSPRLRIVLDGAEFNVEARSDRLYGLGMLDRSPTRGARVSAHESRRRGTISLAVGSIPRASFFVEGRQRSGEIDEVKRRRTELAVGTRLELSF